LFLTNVANLVFVEQIEQTIFMTWQYLYLFVIFSSAAITSWIAVYAWRHRDKTGTLMFAGMMLAVSEWLFTSGMVSTSQTPAQAFFWVNPRYFGLTAMLAFFITFVIQYTGHGKWLTRPRFALIFSVPIITQIIIETNPRHHWFLAAVEFSPDGILMGLDAVRYGSLFWIHTVYSYLLVLVGIGLVVRISIRRFPIYREQAVFMVLGVLPPLLTSVTDAFLLIPGLKHPLAPLGFGFMGMSFAYAMFRHRMLDIVPVARDLVIESMSDAMIVLDPRANVVDINPSAQRYLKLDPSEIIGKPIEQVFYPWKEHVRHYQGQMFAQSEITINLAGQNRCFDMRISPLIDHRQHPNGRIIILRDITQRKQTENQLQETLSTVKALQEQLYEQTIRDPLTNLYNRRLFDEIMDREMERAARIGYPVSIVMMDIDSFKVINDTFGHKAGDLMLKHLASILEEHTRASDYVFRYGGEEFLVILPAAHPRDAYQCAERWRQALQSTVVNYGGEEISVTMSVGIAGVLPGGETPEEVLSAADNAMYRAKVNGRNCVALFRAYP